MKILAAHPEKQNPLDILHHCTEPQSLKSLISCPLPSCLTMRPRFFFLLLKACVEEGVDDENL